MNVQLAVLPLDSRQNFTGTPSPRQQPSREIV